MSESGDGGKTHFFLFFAQFFSYYFALCHTVQWKKKLLSYSIRGMRREC